MPKLHHHFLLLLLLLLATSLSSAASADTHNFKEAPQFSNSPNCPSPSLHHLCSSLTVHVAMTLDSSYLRGSMALILSLLHHSSCPLNIFFHFITTPSLNDTVTSSISISFPSLRFRTYTFDHDAVSGLISTSIRSALDSPLNYARNYLPHLLPACVPRALYLDSDLILVDDVADLFNTPIPTDAVLAAPEYCNADLTSYFTPTFWSNPSLSLTFSVGRRNTPCYFNTGVMVVDLKKWREGGYTRKLIEWMELQKRIRIYDLGSLPPFLLLFAGNVAPVDHRWNQHGLGGDNFKGLCRDLHPGPVSLLHWSGKGKPWDRLDSGRPCPLDALWAPYDLFRPQRSRVDQAL